MPLTAGTVGSVGRLALPILLSSLAAALNHLTDRFFLARAADAGLEAVLPAGMLSVILTNILVATVGYSATVLAQFHGGGHARDAAQTFAQGLFLTLLSAPLFLLAVPVGCAALDFAGHAPAILAAEKTYFSFCQPAGLLVLLTAVLGGLFTGQGHTKYVGFCAIIGALSNILFDRVLILGWGSVPALGIRGAGLATVLSQVTPCILLAARAVRDPLLRAFPVRETFRPNLRLAAHILRLGIPNGLNVLSGSGTFTVFTLVLGRLDAVSLAASNVVFAINNIYYLTAVALGQAVTILSARAFGRGDRADVRRTFLNGLVLAFAALVLFFAAVLPFDGFWLGLFNGGNADSAAFLTLGRKLLLVLLVREIAEGTLCILVGLLRGIGETRFMMTVKAGIEVLVWTPLVLLLAHVCPSAPALWLTMPLCLGLSAACLYWRCERLLEHHSPDGQDSSCLSPAATPIDGTPSAPKSTF